MSDANTANTTVNANTANINIIISQTDANTVKGGVGANDIFVAYQTHPIFENYHVNNYFANTLPNKIMSLSDSDRSNAYQMMTDYADTINMIFSDINSPVLNYISNTSSNIWTSTIASADAQNNANTNAFVAIIDYTNPEQFIADYENWKKTHNS